MSTTNKRRKEKKLEENLRFFSLQWPISEIAILFLLFLREEDLKVCVLCSFLVFKVQWAKRISISSSIYRRDTFGPLYVFTMRKTAHKLPCRLMEHWQKAESSTINLCLCLSTLGHVNLPCVWWMGTSLRAGKSLTGGCFYLSSSPVLLLPCSSGELQSCGCFLQSRDPFPHGVGKAVGAGSGSGASWWEIQCQPRARRCPDRDLFKALCSNPRVPGVDEFVCAGCFVPFPSLEQVIQLPWTGGRNWRSQRRRKSEI